MGIIFGLLVLLVVFAGPIALIIVLCTHKTCPHCKQSILKDAKVCNHCGRDV